MVVFLPWWIRSQTQQHIDSQFAKSSHCSPQQQQSAGVSFQNRDEQLRQFALTTDGYISASSTLESLKECNKEIPTNRLCLSTHQKWKRLNHSLTRICSITLICVFFLLILQMLALACWGISVLYPATGQNEFLS